MTRLVLLAFGGAIALAACQSTEPAPQLAWTQESLHEAGHQPMAPGELEELLSKPLRYAWTIPNGRSGVAEMLPDGTMRVTSGKWRTMGHWRLDGDRICSVLDELPERGDKCVRWYRTGEVEVVSVDEDGMQTGVNRLEP